MTSFNPIALKQSGGGGSGEAAERVVDLGHLHSSELQTLPVAECFFFIRVSADGIWARVIVPDSQRKAN